MPIEPEEQLAEWIRADALTMELLRATLDLAPAESFVAAGAIRNLAWDRLHGYQRRTPLTDIDVIYYDAHDRTAEAEEDAGRRLHIQMPGVHWQVRNQARMHERNGEPPYASTARAMQAWPETATAVGARLLEDGSLQFVQPWGLEDLFALELRLSPLCANPEVFDQRVRDKQWLQLWPRLKLVR